MWLIPGKTKLNIEIFKGIGLIEILMGLVTAGIVTLLLLSELPGKLIIAGIIVCIVVFLILRVDDEPNYQLVLHMLQYLNGTKSYIKDTSWGKGKPIQKVVAFTDIKDNLICYDGKYFGAVLEIEPVEFRLYSEQRRRAAITNGLGKVFRSIPYDHCANIVKLERPIHYEHYRLIETQKLTDLRSAYENGFLTEEELKARVEIIYDRIDEIDRLILLDKVVVPYYYLVLFDSDQHRLENLITSTLNDLEQTDLHSRRLKDAEIAVFLKYSNGYDVNEDEIKDMEPEEYKNWAMPDSLNLTVRTAQVNGLISHTMKVNRYPIMVGDAWLASVMTMPGTKVVVKARPMDIGKSIKNIDRSLTELRGQAMTTGIESKRLEAEQHIESLSSLLQTLQGNNESLLETNIYVTAYDYMMTEASPKLQEPVSSTLPRITNMKKEVRRAYSERGFRLANMDFQQIKAFIGSQVSAYDPFGKEGRGIPANSLAASYPWIFANISDPDGVKLGRAEEVPVFLDFFKRDSLHVNSNMVIVGKSGSGKSYATKSVLANLAADNAKIFILDPENEYTQLAQNLHGKMINVGNAQYGRMNPFQIITALDDDDQESSAVSGSYATHLQFLEEFFKQILPDCDRDALEYLNTIIERMYLERGIHTETDLSQMGPSDYPIFDDLYDAILEEFQQTDNEYIRSMLRTLMNYISKFSAGGRNANIWNGPSSISTEENFTVFNFQSLLSNRNQSIANAQMLLVLKYIDNEIIKNRDYNLRYRANRKIVVVIDEAHVFIDTKYPVALDFMFQLAKRIRKYNGMQIVITQNIKDFVGSEEIARKSTAIINACQYSFIFSLAPNDMEDLCKLYEKAGGINETEQENIVSAGRGQAFTVLSYQERSSFTVETTDGIVDMFQNQDYISQYFVGETGQGYWEDFIGESRQIHDENVANKISTEMEAIRKDSEKSHVSFKELTQEDAEEMIRKAQEAFLAKKNSSAVSFAEVEELPEEDEFSEEDEFPEIDDDLAFDAWKKAAEPEEKKTAPVPAVAAAPVTAISSETDALLMKLLSEMSHENMKLKIQMAVEEEVKKHLAEQPVVVQKPIITKAADPKLDEDVEEDILNLAEEEELYEDDDDEDDDDNDDEYSFDIFGGLFDSTDDEDDDEEEDDDDDDFDWGDDEDDEDDDDNDDPLDFISLLAEEAEASKDLSAIDEMEIYDESVIDISIDDLKQFIRKNRR